MHKLMRIVILVNCVIHTVYGVIHAGTRIPTIDLGEVDLSSHPECNRELYSSVIKCQNAYYESVYRALKRHDFYVGAESVRRMACCGVWGAKHCVVVAANRMKQCGPVVADLYRALPSKSDIRTHVADQCSEYGERAPICHDTIEEFRDIGGGSAAVVASFWLLLSSLILLSIYQVF